MRYTVQFVDDPGNTIEEWHADADDAYDLAALTMGVHWPDGAVRMRILDADGRVVQERHTP
jgi:hypothetical protein